ncbi:hypothetical protein L6164_013375 [Bauhinia variegata]|uniref:Uncharacterized protein n=1 Tax=Bauhinia variegata TaxID=167791 RepID=A0ACB9NEQ9_BAUVA|nr:hypothetical protein L6164_013375 [Bauhinia variegata]
MSYRLEIVTVVTAACVHQPPFRCIWSSPASIVGINAIHTSNEYENEIWHGEQLEMPSMSQRDDVDVDMDERLDDMICDIGAESFERSHVFDKLCSDVNKPFYLGCNLHSCQGC